MNAFFETQDISPKRHQETMPKLDMELNMRVYVRINPLGKRVKPLQGEFLGLLHFEFLMLKLPSVPGVLSSLIPQAMVEVRFLQAGAVHTFTTEVISHSVKPALVLFTTYPDRLSVLETRRHVRTACALPLFINSKLGGVVGVVSDLSMGGCRISIELTGQSFMRTLAAKDRVILQTVFSADGAPVTCAAVVRNVESTGSRLVVGIAFDPGQAEFAAALSRYLELVQVLV